MIKNQKYNQIIQQLQAVSDHPVYFTLTNGQVAYQDSRYQTCINLAQHQWLKREIINETHTNLSTNQLIVYKITSLGSQILGQCKYLNARIDSQRSVEQIYIKQQKYCLWLILVPILLFIASWALHISTYFMILSIVLMFFIFGLAIVNSLHYKRAMFNSKRYASQIPNILGEVTY